MLRFSYETLTNSWFYGEWIVKIIAKVMIKTESIKDQARDGSGKCKNYDRKL